MKIPGLLRLLFLCGLTRASIGFELRGDGIVAQTSQPHHLSLDVDLFLQINQHEFKLPIMPLHLLGKKSWNVYNTVNIEKVRKDEAIAAAKEAEEEERMQALDAERRMQILRGEEPTPLPIEDAPRSPSSKHERADRSHGLGRERKRRKKAGENDTDFEMRVAREEAEDRENVVQALVLRKDPKIDAPLTDERGHISLFPQETPKKGAGKAKNAEVEREKERKKKEYEDQYTMRFSNAAGFKQSLGEAPWYEKNGRGREEADEVEVVGKDVWGNEDPRRRQREEARMVSSDPLAMMREGARRVREVEREREKWREERERDVGELEEREGRRRRKREAVEDDGLEGFDLDGDRDEARKVGSKRRRSGYEDEEKERRHRHRHGESKRNSYGEKEEDRRRHKHRHRHSHHV